MQSKLRTLREKGRPLVGEDQTDFLDKLTVLSRGGVNGNKSKMNPLKVLEPNRKKLHSLAAQRTLCILDEAKAKCNLIIILRYILRDLQNYESILGAELTKIIQEHSEHLSQFHSMEQVYFDLPSIVSRSNTAASSVVNTAVDMKPSTNIRRWSRPIEDVVYPINFEKMKDPAEVALLPGYGSVRSSIVEANAEENFLRLKTTHTVQELNKLKLELEFSIRDILRAFRPNEEVMTRLIAECTHGRTREGLYFIQCLTELKDMLLERLLTPPSEQNDRIEFLTQIAAQDRSNALMVEKIESELEKAVEDRDKDIKARNITIHTLQVNLQMLEKSSEEDIKRVNNESEKQKIADNKVSMTKKNKLSAELKMLQTALNNNVIDHREEEHIMRMKKYKIECEIENWVHKFDMEMIEKQNEYEEIDERYQEEKKQLAELEQRFNTLEVEYKEIMRLKEIERQTVEGRQTLEQKQIHAVTIIQALWRAFKVRQHMKEKLNGKKNKGKKNGKAKK